jgi:hypothetical protein
LEAVLTVQDSLYLQGESFIGNGTKKDFVGFGTRKEYKQYASAKTQRNSTSLF